MKNNSFHQLQYLAFVSLEEMAGPGMGPSCVCETLDSVPSTDERKRQKARDFLILTMWIEEIAYRSKRTPSGFNLFVY